VGYQATCRHIDRQRTVDHLALVNLVWTNPGDDDGQDISSIWDKSTETGPVGYRFRLQATFVLPKIF
jgi:hypothetical protein